MYYLIHVSLVGLNLGWIERKRHSKEINYVSVIVLNSYFNYMHKYLNMEKAYELHQVKQGRFYFSRNKEYGPIIPYLSADIKLCVAFIKVNIDPTC